jgi:hypothetical protein
MIERSGFRIDKQYSPVFYRIPFLRRVNSLFLPFGFSCLQICEKIENFRVRKKEDSLFLPKWALRDLQILG